MRASRLVVGALVAALLLTGATAPAAAQAGSEIDSEICPGTSDNNLVLRLPDGSTVGPEGSVALYPGTRIDVALCNDGDVELADGVAWSLDSADGVTVVSSHERRYVVEIDDVSGDVEVDLGSAVPERDRVRSPALTATAGSVAAVDVGEETRRVSLPNADESNALRENGSAYRERASEIRDAASSVASAAESDETVDEATFERLDGDGELGQRYDAVQSTLFAAAARGDADAIAALDAYATHREETVAAAEADLETARDRYAARARDRATSVLANFVGFLLVGAAVGAAGGWYVTKGIMKDVEYKRSRVSGFDFGSGQLAKQSVVAVASVVAAAGIAAYFGLLGPLWAVFRAVVIGL